ncbi:TOMM precursor leader peptide-binding protein [Streptomyces virginiae]|uniref:TOMM precursor leader peptide-binding protein n=1 Tax=Streptomyces TaxID=1883 RepID=UPI0006AEED55|nr:MULTISPECIES: TOMM precursor leader peptide-binding protein [unclassified Streptomyces]KOV23875.1 thiamine biosynthesis protein ThiF [Streptomyces sp. XY413]KOV36679.1 thiamine biosynthesis protein ThiF [Streptomyces sp. H021]
MFPRVKPALARAWRDLQTVQFGVTPAHAVVLGPVDTATGALIDRIDGTRGMELLRAEAARMGLPDGLADALVRRLAGAGLLDDASAGGPRAQALRRHPETLERLGPDLGSLSLVHREPGGDLRGIAARRAVRVRVRGSGRVGAVIASVLSGAGVGRVEVLDGGRVEPADVAPGGLGAASVGRMRAEAAAGTVRSAAPGPGPRAGEEEGPEPGLALVVVAPRDGLHAWAPDPDTAADWVASGIPHLYAGVLEGTGLVGPLVLPGMTACAGCMERDRVDRDAAWPRMLVQWRSSHRRRGSASCDLGLSTAVAGLAAAHALAFLDGGLPASTGSRWEAALPTLHWESAPVRPHPDCPCGAASESAERLQPAGRGPGRGSGASPPGGP